MSAASGADGGFGFDDAVDAIAGESRRLAGVVASADLDARVPTTPKWSLRDLAHHVGAVQWYWSATLGVGLLGQQGVPLRGQVLRPAQPFGQRGQREPGLLGVGQGGRGLLRGLFQVGFGLPGLGQLLLQGSAPSHCGRLVGLVALQVSGQYHVVVSQQPQPGVAQLGLD